MDFEIGFMEQQCGLLVAVRRLVPEVNYLSTPLQVKVLSKLREMFATMKEHAKHYRAAYAFQVLLVQLEKKIHSISVVKATGRMAPCYQRYRMNE